MIRILHVVESTTGGVRRHISTQVQLLDRDHFDVAVACPPQRDQAFGDTGFVHDIARLGVPIHTVRMLRAIRPAADTRALVSLARLLRAERFDIVHAHSSKAGFLARAAARLTGGAATVYTPHSLYFTGLRSPLKRRFFLALEQAAGYLTDRIVAVSPSERDAILHERIARPEQVVCIENGVAAPVLPPDYDRAAQRAALGQPGDGPLIGTVARLAEQKNPGLFLEAAARLARQRPDARFVWCGSGELAEQAQALALALGIAPHCRFLGHREDVVPILAALDLFWLTSSYEGMPCVLLEAMALSLPIVATDVVGTRDVLAGTAGLLVPPSDAAALAGVSLRLLELPQRRAALARAGFTRYQEHGGAARMVRKTEQMYHDLVQQREGRLRYAITNVNKP